MQTAALNDVSSQRQELRYLTAHFRDLQGLRMAPLWLGLLVLTSLAKTGSFSRGHLAWAAAALIAAQFGWLHLGGLWYERRYGVVKEPDTAVPSGLISIMHPEGRRSVCWSIGSALWIPQRRKCGSMSPLGVQLRARLVFRPSRSARNVRPSSRYIPESSRDVFVP